MHKPSLRDFKIEKTKQQTQDGYLMHRLAKKHFNTVVGDRYTFFTAIKFGYNTTFSPGVPER